MITSDTGIKENWLRFKMAMLVFIPIFAVSEYTFVTYSEDKTYNLITLEVTSSDSPRYIQVSHGDTSYDVCALKGQEFDCHFWITPDPMEVITNNREGKELFDRIQRGDKLTITIQTGEEKQLDDMYDHVRLSGLSLGNDILFSPEHLKELRKDNMRSTLVIAAMFECVIFLSVLWKIIRTRLNTTRS